MNDRDPPAPPSALVDKRLLKRQYREAGPAMGVYAIRNLATGRVRVRASMNLEGSMQRDRFELGLKSHRDKELLGEWQRWGGEHFSFAVLDTLKRSDDPAFDPAAELATLLALWTDELRAGPSASSAAQARPRASPTRLEEGADAGSPCRPC